VHPRLSISAVSSWRWSLDDDLRFWARAGIDHVGLSLRKLEEAGLPGAAHRVRDAGLRVSNIVELGWWRLDDPSTWPRQQERLAQAVDAAVVTGAPCLVLTSGPAGPLSWDEAAVALDEALAPVRAHARERGVALTLEHTSTFRLDLSFVTRLDDAVDLARRLHVEVCVEIGSCFADRGLDATIRAACDVVGHVQVSDFVVGSLSTPDRAVPGDGDIPLDRIVPTLVRSGYPGAFELELVGPRIEEEGYAAAIGRSIDYLDDLLGGIPFERSGRE
jgi:sugar phosphate isomerase/epimerase